MTLRKFKWICDSHYLKSRNNKLPRQYDCVYMLMCKKACFISLICQEYSWKHGNRGSVWLGRSNVRHLCIVVRSDLRICWIICLFFAFICATPPHLSSNWSILCCYKMLSVMSLYSFGGGFVLILSLNLGLLRSQHASFCNCDEQSYPIIFISLLLVWTRSCGSPPSTLLQISVWSVESLIDQRWGMQAEFMDVFLQTNTPHYWIITIDSMLQLNRMITLITASWSLVMETEQV